MRESIDLKTLQRELKQALKLINDHSIIHNGTSKAEVDTEGLNNTQSLLERCAAVVDKDNANTKPTLRIIHHFACSGGTLISKCLAAQPNVFLLSELHPTTRLAFSEEHALYTPRDIATQAFYGRLPRLDNLAEKIFLAGIKEAEQHVRELGGALVIRAHTHADYCTGIVPPEQDTLTRLLDPFFDIKNLVTVRNPIDSFLSLRENKWVHFKPDTFEEYCCRLLKFLNSHEASSIIHYEDFVLDPRKFTSRCAEILDMLVNNLAHDYIDVFNVSGDSGRSGSEIKLRKRKSISSELKQEILNSLSFKEICAKYEIQPIS